MTDEMIVALAKKGGVVQSELLLRFSGMADARRRCRSRARRATLDDVVAHIDHIRKIAGIDAIGIGSDFEGSMRAGGPGRCLEVSEPDAGAAGEGLYGRGYPQDLWRQFAAGDEGGGTRCGCKVAS